MKSLLYQRFKKYALIRTFFWGAMGALLFFFPEFLTGGMFYAIIGYLLLNGLLRIVDFSHEKNTKTPLSYGSLVLAVVFCITGLTSMGYARYLVKISPVYLGTLLLFETVIYFTVALCAAPSWKKKILVMLSLLSFLGSAAVFVFTFGFGIGGIQGLIFVSCAASFLSCAYALAVAVFHE